MRMYLVNYSRKIITGERIHVTNQVMNESDLKLILMDESKFEYIVESAKLIPSMA